MQYLIGIDNSSLDHKIRIIDENGNKKMSFSIKNSYEGFEILHTRISNLDDVKIGFELPHGPLVDFLHSNA